MKTFRRALPQLLLFVALVASFPGLANADGQLSEKDLVKLIEFGIDDQAIANKIGNDGLEFESTDEVLERLRNAGASELVLSAVKASAQARPSAGTAITYADVLDLVKLGIGEEAILKRLAKSPTLFVLDATQQRELQSAGASEPLIAALEGQRRPPERAHDITDFAIILDCSGSMKEQTRDGQAKISVARRVVTELIQRIPNGLNLTFVIYGHDRDLQCQAVKVARPLSELDSQSKSKLAEMIAALQPAGATPIALALRTAGKELAKNDAYCGLVLISDGKETCQSDPAGEVAALANNLKLTFGAHVVGFDVDADGRAQLEHVAARGGGKYYNARNADELAQAIDSIEREIEKVVPEKPPVELVKAPYSAIQMSPFALEGVVGIEEAYIVRPGQNPNAYDFDQSAILQRTNEFSKPMPIGVGKYDIVCKPAAGRNFTLLKSVEVKPQRLMKINTNQVVGVIAVKDPMFDGLEAKKLYVVRPDENPNAYDFLNSPLQDCDGFDETMLVTAGEAYDVVLEPTEGQRATIAQKIVPQAGQLTTVGGEDGE